MTGWCSCDPPVENMRPDRHSPPAGFVSWPPPGMEEVDAAVIVDALAGYRIVNSEVVYAGIIMLELQGEELPDLTLRISGGYWAAKVDA